MIVHLFRRALVIPLTLLDPGFLELVGPAEEEEAKISERLMLERWTANKRSTKSFAHQTMVAMV